jgi:hypothetical protein
MTNLFFYCAIVSKSLLTVLGTFPRHRTGIHHSPPIVASGRPCLSRERTPLTSGRHLRAVFGCGGKNAGFATSITCSPRDPCGQAAPGRASVPRMTTPKREPVIPATRARRASAGARHLRSARSLRSRSVQAMIKSNRD